MIGRHSSFQVALERLARFAKADDAALISGETGTGKELFARALYLLSSRAGHPFITVNCAQYVEGQLIASELFGHRKGSFTGAMSDHCGVFETAKGGVVFLDEVGELTSQAQGMLLRVLSESEIVRVGEPRPRHVDVRIVCATNRDLGSLVAAGRFRSDLYYRLRGLQLKIPPLRERGTDWEYIVEYFLADLSTTHCCRKNLSETARSTLREYRWPGNVREVRGVVDTGFYVSSTDVIEPTDFIDALEDESRNAQWQRLVRGDESDELYDRLVVDGESFWDAVYQPYLDRELCRDTVRRLIDHGLTETRGSYKMLLALFGIAPEKYLKFMDFLRHHHLKPRVSAWYPRPPRARAN